MVTHRDSLAALRNLGPSSAARLRDAGIASPEELRQLGAVLAFKLVEHRHGGASVNLLYALHGALSDRHWASLSSEERNELRAAAGLPPAPRRPPLAAGGASGHPGSTQNTPTRSAG